MEFKIGDRVIAKKNMGIMARIEKGMTGTVIGNHYCSVSVEFDKDINGHDCYGKGKNGHCWNCEPDTIEKIVKETKLEDITFKKGDIVTLKDGTISVVLMNGADLGSLCYKNPITKIERATGYTTIYETPKDILDKEEKEYLSAVIKPFRKKDSFIEKIYSKISDKEYIYINTTYTSKISDGIMLPYFKKGTMYKGMETYKKYTLEELGL